MADGSASALGWALMQARPDASAPRVARRQEVTGYGSSVGCRQSVRGSHYAQHGGRFGDGSALVPQRASAQGNLAKPWMVGPWA